jgi:hypothetical protein
MRDKALEEGADVFPGDWGNLYLTVNNRDYTADAAAAGRRGTTAGAASGNDPGG